MIGGISFSATSITSGLDADKPVSPKPGNQYLATDTEIVYVCYVAGVWVDAAPPIDFYVDIPMIAGMDMTIFQDPTGYSKNVSNHNSNIIKRFLVEEVKGFTDTKSFNVNIEFGRDSQGGTTFWSIRINGAIKISNSFIHDVNSWMIYEDLPITGALKPGDYIEVFMSHSGATPETRKTLYFKNFTIKCANPVLTPKRELSLSLK